MLHVFLIKLGNGQKLERNQEHQDAERELSAHPMFQKLEQAISAMECHIAETTFKYKVLLQLRSEILEALGIKEKNKPELKTKTTERKKEAPEVKTPPSESKDPRLAILEEGIKKVIKIFKKSPMLKRFKSLKQPLKVFIAAMEKSKQCQTETERIAQLEAAIGEGLSCLQNSKMTLRSNVLKEIKKTLEETIDSKNQISK